MKGWKKWMESAQFSGDDRELRELWEITGRYKESWEPDAEAAFRKFQRKRAAEQRSRVGTRRRLNPRYLLRVAAVALVLLGVGFALRQLLPLDPPLQTALTQTGEVQVIRFEDGTSVSLNQNSRLLFPKKWSAYERRVLLEGEAFFEVEPDPKRPFIVETAESEIQVLGTAFNVRAYPGLGFQEVHVERGRVAFRSKNTGEEQILEALQLQKLDVSTHHFAPPMKTTSFNSNGWATRKLRFRNAPLQEVFNSLEGLYRVRFQVEDPSVLECRYTTTIEYGELEEALRTMGLAFEGLRFRVEGDVVRVEGHCP
ncbi:MAG: DUF4974 domain-containing protein [Bacteroidetes bacterium]|nr:MAG: DUF4974 domain-containing protein [Bacteroidota bacterium]